jgi:NhaA family Na+:H+ antiporter
MSIFIANLAFTDTGLLNAAKLGVLIASSCAAVIGLIVGKLLVTGPRERALGAAAS